MVMDIYDDLCKFVDSSKDNKYELSQVLYPIFVHIFMDMVGKDLNNQAHEFFDKFVSLHSSMYSNELKQLRMVYNKEQLARCELKEIYNSTKYNVKLSEDSYRLLREFVRLKNSKALVELIKENMMLEIYNGSIRDYKQQSICTGGLLGEANSNKNTTKIFHGLIREPDLSFPDEAEDMGEEEGDKPKKRKNKRDTMIRKNRNDPNAPPFNRVPLPELRDIDRQNRQQAMRDYVKRARLSLDKLPSICFYTILNSYNNVNCCDLSEDSQWLALGLADSTIKICSVSEKAKLKVLKPIQDLEMLDKETDDVGNYLFDENSSIDHRSLIGHTGPVYSVCFSPDKNFVISGSEDGTVRLWCILTSSCLVSYKGHNGPVWDVKFGPYGHYFASCGTDRTARLWALDQYQSLRLYSDHLSDVECICFHPNSNYLATGSLDRNVRIYDLASSTEDHQVRQFTGHKSSINVVKFSTCGRYLASGGYDAMILIWDISTAVIVARFTSHKEPIYSLDFSRDNSALASGGIDNTIKVWNMLKLTKDVEQCEDLTKFSVKTEAQYEMGSWKTKLTPIFHLHFTRSNLLVGVGPFKHSADK